MKRLTSSCWWWGTSWLDNLFIIWIKQILKLVVVTSIIGFGAYQLDQQHQCFCFVIYSRIWCISIKSTSMLLFFHCWMKVMKSKDDVRFVCKSPNTFAICLSCEKKLSIDWIIVLKSLIMNTQYLFLEDGIQSSLRPIVVTLDMLVEISKCFN